MMGSRKSLLTSSRHGLWPKLTKTIFQILILFIPSQLALHLWPKWAYIYAFKIDYFSPALYLSDIFILLLFLLWLVRTLLFKDKVTDTSKKNKLSYVALLFLAILAAANSYLAISQPLAFYKWLKVAEFVFFGWFVAKSSEFEFDSWVLKPLKVSMVIVLGIAAGQFLLQRTIGGPLYLLGERTFSVTTPGIATFSLFGREMLRPYSTFPHPNALAGYLGVGFLLFIFYRSNKQQLALNNKIFLTLILIIFLLTISQGAWLSLLLSLLLTAFIFKKPKIVKQRLILIGILVVLLSILLPIFSEKALRVRDFEETVTHRLRLAKTAGQIINQYPLFGIGNGNYILGLVNNAEVFQESWQLQPVHNIVLLVLAEGGLVWHGIFFVFLLATTNMIGYQKNKAFAAVYIFILLTGSVDHYWLTLQQTQLILAIILGSIYRK